MAASASPRGGRSIHERNVVVVVFLFIYLFIFAKGNEKSMRLRENPRAFIRPDQIKWKLQSLG